MPEILDVLFSRHELEDGSLGYQPHVFLSDDRVLCLGICSTLEEANETVREFLEMRDAINNRPT